MLFRSQEKKEKEQAEREKAEGLEDLEDELDSEEERIMQQELEKRRKTAESKREEMAKKLKNDKYGTYTEIIETEFLETMLKNEKVVCHFYHKDFERCKIIDKHLKIIAQNHKETLFVKGKAIHRFIGFQDFGMNDDFPTINLSRQLVLFKMIQPKTKAEKGEVTIRKGKKDDSDDEEDY